MAIHAANRSRPGRRRSWIVRCRIRPSAARGRCKRRSARGPVERRPPPTRRCPGSGRRPGRCPIAGRSSLTRPIRSYTFSAMASRARVLSSLFVRESVRALLRHKVRSSLTAIGIMVGIAAVVLCAGVGEAASRRAQAQFQALGDNLVWVEAGSRNVAGVRTGSHGTTSLTVEDADAIRREVPLIKRISPQVDGTILVIHGDRNWTPRYRGETPDYLAIKGWDVALGAPFTDEDVADSASKVLIGRTVREQLFGAANPIGEIVRINGQLFEVVGVLGAKGQTPDGRDQDDWLLLPYTAAMTKLRGRTLNRYLDDILCSAIAPEAVVPAIERVTALLRDRHRIGRGDEDDFNIRRPDEVLKAQIEAARTLELLL